MELRHLRYFLAAAETLHFTRAAESLAVSQPTLSQQIKELEGELGAPLFDRIGRSVRLTAAGALFRAHALRALLEVDTGRSAVADLQGVRRGTVRVGVTHSFSTALMPRVVADFRRRHPGVGVAIEKSTGRAVEQALVAGTLELGIAFAPPEAPEVVAETLFDEEVVLITSRTHPLASHARVKLAELDGLPLVLTNREFATRRLLDDRMREGRVLPQIIVETNDIDLLLEIARLGTGATVLSRRAVTDPRELVLIPIIEPTMARTAALFWRRDCYRSAAAKAFAEVIREVSAREGALPR